MSEEEPKIVAIFFSSGDLGDVGRHAVAAALDLPCTIVSTVRVLSSCIQSLEEDNWKCGCGKHSFPEIDTQRLQLVRCDCTTQPLEDHLQGVHAVISCLGNRKPFHSDCIAKTGTERIVRAILNSRSVQRLVVMSSVGISDDWPPMEWSSEGSRLQGFFRTICWRQYQDLSGAELAVRQGAHTSPQLDFLIVRSVLLDETAKPVFRWYIQNAKHKDHPVNDFAKMDCARFMVQEAVCPTIRRRAIVVGAMPKIESAVQPE
jgi:hypothetical protein